MSKKRRGDFAEFSISFLDVICCGFGAIVLLLIIAKTVEPIVLEESAENLDGQIKNMQATLFELRGETLVYNRELNAKREQLALEEERIAILKTRQADLEARFAKVNRGSASEADMKGQLEIALQSLTDEMKRLYGENAERKNDYIGGIPVDSEYVVFLIDTSGSMFEYAWERVMQEMENILDIYPNIKGIQVMNDMGEYMFPTYRDSWIPDTPARRQAILKRLQSWNVFSNSSPIEGIQKAIRTFYAPDKKISLYVFGDDLQPNHSITKAVDIIDKLNRKGLTDERLVRIHGVGFPVLFQLASPREQVTANRFAALMREVAHRNGGTFVGLSDYRAQE